MADLSGRGLAIHKVNKCKLQSCMQGYPGNVKASITYILQAGGSLRTIFEATTDKTTPINMAQHSYFNLSGHSTGSVLGHKILING